VEIDPDEMARNYPPTIGILGDVKTFLIELLKRLEGRLKGDQNRNRVWLDQIAVWREGWESFIRPGFSADSVPIAPTRLVGDIRAVMPRDGILVSDVGEHHNWLLQFYDAYEPMGLLQSWGFAGMGFGVCGVLGAKLAAPDKVCVSVCGDGGFMMTPHIVSTAVEYHIPAVWIVWNNYGYNVIRHQANGAWPGREIATSFKDDRSGVFLNPDFAALARACGAQGARVERPQDFRGVFAQAIESQAPFVIDVVVDRDARAPSTGTWVLPPFVHGEPTYGKRNVRTA
jgi:acetolactate synthase-1/2/3 large subunit